MDELTCPNCGSENVIEIDYDVYQCQDCGDLIDSNGGSINERKARINSYKW